MGITRIYERNKVQQMIGKRKSFKYFAEPNKALKQLASREQPYREQTERERKINEERRIKRNGSRT